MNTAQLNPPGVAPAHWLWGDEPAVADTWRCFRTEIDLPGPLAQALITVAADTHYWLWINGRLVVRNGGLKRGPTPDDGYADTPDLGPHLVEGRNTLAFLVWFLGPDEATLRELGAKAPGASHCSSGRGAFLVAGDLGGIRLASDRTWRTRVHPSFRRTGKGTTVTLSEWWVDFDSRPEPCGWTQANFDDSSWPQATELGEPPAPPWGKLMARPIPLWRDGVLRPYENHAELALPREGPAQLIGRMPANLQALPWFRVEAEPGCVIDIQPDPHLVSSHGTVGIKTTRFTTAGGVQEFECPTWSVYGGFVTYVIPAGVRVLELGWRPTSYDCEIATGFTSSAPDLDRLWAKSALSVYVNLRDTFMDCPDRERSQWPLDATLTARIAGYALSPSIHQLTAKFYRELAQWRTSDGILWGAVPTGRFRGTFREFPGQTLGAIHGLGSFFRQSGDEETLRVLAPTLMPYLLEHYRVDAGGFIEHRGPYAVEWGTGTQAWYDWGLGQDIRLLDQAWYLLALQAALAVFSHLGMDSERKACAQRHDDLFQKVRDLLWDETAGGYRGPIHSQVPNESGQGEGTTFARTEIPDERGNALLILAGLTDPARIDRLAELLATQDRCSIAFEGWILEALSNLGRTDLALSRLRRRYAGEIASEHSTLPESFSPPEPGMGGYNHAWGGSPAVFLAQNLFGLTPEVPGWQQLRLAPSTLLPNEARLDLLLPCGPVHLIWQACPARLEIDVPTPATLIPPGQPSAWTWVSPDLQHGATPRWDTRANLWLCPPGRWAFFSSES